MLTYAFNETHNDALYEHLYKCIKKDILENNLQAHAKLPSKRTFAKNLGVSTITVENAYAQLMAEGYIYSLPKKGYYVSEIKKFQVPIVPTPSSVPAFSENLSDIRPCFADFTSNQTNSQYFPFSIWSKLIREQLNDSRHNLMTNPPSGGTPALRTAIAEHLRDFHGLHVAPEQIIIGAGTEYLYGLLIQLLGFDKHYAIENPSYHKIDQIYRSHGIDCDYIAMDDQGVCVRELTDKSVDIIHISPSHQFPTGITTPIARRYELLAWAAASDARYIIEDDYDNEFRLTGQPIPTLQSIDSTEKVIYINTFTKTLASTVRISYMVLPTHLVKAYHAKLYFYSCTVSTFEQYTLAAFISRGYFEKHINRLRNYYRDKRNRLLATISQSPLSNHVTIFDEDAGLHFLMHINTNLEDDVFCQRALQMGVRLSALSHYYIAPTQDVAHRFIINYSSLDDTVMDAAISALWHILES